MSTDQKPKGQRQFTRAQRVKVATFLIQAAIDATTIPHGVRAHGLNQLGRGLHYLARDGGVDRPDSELLATAGLHDALTDSVNTADAAALATAWELAIWPVAAPANKKSALQTADA